MQEVGDAVRDCEHDDPEQHLHRARTMDEQEDAVDREAHQRHFENVAPSGMKQPDLFEKTHCFPCCIIAHATSSAWRAGRASCTRNKRAPRSNEVTFAAIDPGSRSAGFGVPLISPMNRFRDTPTRTG